MASAPPVRYISAVIEKGSERWGALVSLVADNREVGWGGKTVLVSGVDVADATKAELVDWLSLQWRPAGPLLAYALHIGGLVHLDERPGYRTTMNQSAIVYADGAATVILGRFRGGNLERSATTDIAPAVLAKWVLAGDMPRIALLGGPDNLAGKAGDELERLGLGTIVYSGSGFGADWPGELAKISDAAPDVFFVGMGAPREMNWCEEYFSELPHCIVMTCGGWFGFLAGEERRAPTWAQFCGCEWVWRLAQNPSHLLERYMKGLLTFAKKLLQRS